MNPAIDPDDRGLLRDLAGDGRPLLSLTGLALILSGGFALFLSATRQFLPHDVQFLGMQPDDLCALSGCRIVHFMFHDRVSFGGVIIALGILYLWLAEFPLKRGEPWAWWLFLGSGAPSRRAASGRRCALPARSASAAPSASTPPSDTPTSSTCSQRTQVPRCSRRASC